MQSNCVCARPALLTSNLAHINPWAGDHGMYMPGKGKVAKTVSVMCGPVVAVCGTIGKKVHQQFAISIAKFPVELSRAGCNVHL